MLLKLYEQDNFVVLFTAHFYMIKAGMTTATPAFNTLFLPYSTRVF